MCVSAIREKFGTLRSPKKISLDLIPAAVLQKLFLQLQQRRRMTNTYHFFTGSTASTHTPNYTAHSSTDNAEWWLKVSTDIISD